MVLPANNNGMPNSDSPNTDRFMVSSKEDQDVTFICLTGHSCSGKSTVSRMLEKLGWPVFQNAPIFTQRISRQRLPLKKLLMTWGRGRSLFYFFEPFLREFAKGKRLIVVDSIKTVHDPTVIHQFFENSREIIIHIHASFEVRLNRLSQRHNQSEIDPFVLRSRDDEESEAGIDQLFKSAFFKLDTNVPLTELHTMVEILFERDISCIIKPFYR